MEFIFYLLASFKLNTAVSVSINFLFTLQINFVSTFIPAKSWSKSRYLFSFSSFVCSNVYLFLGIKRVFCII